MTDAAAVTSFEKANTAYEEGQKAFKENPTLENSLKNYNNIKNRNKMDAVRGAKGNHGYTNPSKDYSAGTVSTGFSGGQAVMPGAYKPPKFASDGEGFTQEQIDTKKKMEEKQKSVAKPKSKIDVGKVAVGANTALSALSGLTGFAAKMGDASRKLVQTALNPSPTGLNEMKGFADTTQQVGDAAKAGIKGISDTQKQFKDNQKLLKERDDFRDYNELEKIREKYVDMMDKAPNESNWGDIAEQYQNEVTKYFTDAGRDMSKLDPNSIQAKQIKRVARELTNMGQRKKSQVGLENAMKVQDAKEKKFEANTKLGDKRSQYKDLKYQPKERIDLMYSTGVDIKGQPLSSKDKDTMDLMVNDLHKVDEMSNWTVGSRFDAETYASLARKAENRARKAKSDSERQKWMGYAQEFYSQTTKDAIAHDDMLAEVEKTFTENPDVPIMEGLKVLNKNKTRGYDLRDYVNIEEIGFTPNKNLIKDFRDVASKKENVLNHQINGIRQNAIAQNRGLNQTEKDQIKALNQKIKYINHQRDLVTPAYLYADVAKNVAEAIERTTNDGSRISPHMIFSDEAEAQSLIANSLNPTGDPDKWFELMKTGDLRYHPTDEQLKAAVMLKARKVATRVNNELKEAWRNHDQLGTPYAGLDTIMQGDDGKPIKVRDYMANSTADILNNYDTSLAIIHRDGSKVPPNGKQIMASIGYGVEDMKDRVLERMDQQTMAMVSGGMGGAPKIPWKFGGGMKVYGSGGAEISVPGGSFKTMTPAQLIAYQTDPVNANKGEEVAKITLGKWLYDVKNTKAFMDFCKSMGTTPDEQFDQINDALEAFMTYDTDPSAGGMPIKYLSKLKNFVKLIDRYEKQMNGPTITNEIYKAYGMPTPKRYGRKSAMSPGMMLEIFKKVP